MLAMKKCDFTNFMGTTFIFQENILILFSSLEISNITLAMHINLSIERKLIRFHPFHSKKIGKTL